MITEAKLWARLAPLVERWAAVAPNELGTATHLDPPDDDLLAYLDANREALAQSLAARSGEVDLASALALAELRWLQGYNQFLDLNDTSREALAAIARRALDGVRAALAHPGDRATLGAAIARVVAAHRTALGRLVSALLAALPGADQGGATSVQCAEYSPELQLSLLGLDVSGLRGPVLDLGCGAEARLVHHLRAAGVDASGLDRAAAPGPFVSARDWFTGPLGGPWGTVISHLGFSHHFMFHHLRGGPQAGRYAKRYMEILNSLAPGGAFVYAPGLPFLEPLLPAASYRVSRKPIAGVEAQGGVAPYACRVERV